MHPFSLALLSCVCFSSLFSLYGDCARCAKIEAERAKEQQAHPKPLRYYDELISLRDSDQPPTPAAPPYSALVTILKTHHLLETFEGPFTLFVPSNEALFRGDFSLLHANQQERLAALVSRHVVARQLLRSDFAHKGQEGEAIKTLSGERIRLKNENGQLTVNDIRIISVQPAGRQGVIYVIDRLL